MNRYVVFLSLSMFLPPWHFNQGLFEAPGLKEKHEQKEETGKRIVRSSDFELRLSRDYRLSDLTIGKHS